MRGATRLLKAHGARFKSGAAILSRKVHGETSLSLKIRGTRLSLKVEWAAMAAAWAAMAAVWAAMVAVWAAMVAAWAAKVHGAASLMSQPAPGTSLRLRRVLGASKATELRNTPHTKHRLQPGASNLSSHMPHGARQISSTSQHHSHMAIIIITSLAHGPIPNLMKVNLMKVTKSPSLNPHAAR